MSNEASSGNYTTNYAQQCNIVKDAIYFLYSMTLLYAKILFIVGDRSLPKIHKMVNIQAKTCKIHSNIIDRNNSVKKHLLTSCTWLTVISSDDFETCDALFWLETLIKRVMYPTFQFFTPLGNDTTGVSNASIKTLQLCWCWIICSAYCTWVRTDNPARWTVDSRRWCCRTELLPCVSVICSHSNTQTSIVLVFIARQNDKR